MKEDLDHPAKIQNFVLKKAQIDYHFHLPLKTGTVASSREIHNMFSKQDLEEEVAELFYDIIKDFPELTFGMIEIKNAFGRFHVILDSVLVFKKVGLYPIRSWGPFTSN